MASISLQDLRRRFYVKAKADKDWRLRGRRGFGWKRWSTAWIYRALGVFNDYRVQYQVRV